jgi:hypothetical protein
MRTQTADLFLVEDLAEDRRTSALAPDERDALRAVAGWIEGFIARPHEDLGRPGTVCPFVPEALKRRELWLAPQQVGDGGVQGVVDTMLNYKRALLRAPATDVDDVDYQVIVVVFTDLQSDHASTLFDDVLDHIAVPSYEDDGIVFGPFFAGHTGTALYNPGFRPFQSPVPLVFVRHGVVSDWKFFLDKPDWLRLWARRFGETAALALADELRRLPWRTAH